MKVSKIAPVVGKVRDEIHQVFDRFFAPRFMTEPYFPPLGVEPANIATWVPVLDLTEAEKDFVLRVEVPGIPKENLDVKLNGDLLTITGRREAMHENKGETYLWQEREYGRFTRTIRLPAAVVEKDILATYQDGVLIVHLPKVAPPVENKILIK